MSNGPKISIITACYNAEKTIEQTIQSVINQTYDNIEYIIVDGASTDGTMQIVKKYEEQIDIIISESDEGIYDAFNKGIKVSTGDFINFMNADDYFSTESIVQEVANHLYEKPNTLMLHGDVKAFDEFTGHWHYRGEPLIYKDFEAGKMCPHQSVFAHRKLFEEFGFFDINYKILADIDFTIKCFQKYGERIDYVPIEIALFRLGGISNALSHERKMHTEHALIRFKHFSCIPDYLKNMLLNFDTYQINQYYKRWLEISITDDSYFEEKNSFLRVQKVAIFGTKVNATYLYNMLKKMGVEVVCFIDNDIKMQNKKLHGKPIISTQNIRRKDISAIIISIEREETANMVKEQIKGKVDLVNIWYELL
ncbi:glycosyltransferase family 2 protein [Metasolibacillus meyeri]|uniref:glycosyltransferase family 2 protein n=1 Tax=Metasolibacillus meyeri TaxID=1071052 RepID=UPI00187D481E|nr:glycosyltransferase family 2 protein [Metasolibacillus meyeri]